VFSNLDHIPGPSTKRIAFRIKKTAERTIRNGHPWLFDRSIIEQSHEGRPGDFGVIFDHKRAFLAIGLYDPFSPIRLRILKSHTPTPINSDFYLSRLLAASRIREVLPGNTTGFRLVHGENDQFPGLVIDKYDKTIVIKIYTVSWIPHLNKVLSNLCKIFPYEFVILRLSRKIQKNHRFLYGLKDGDMLFGNLDNRPFYFLENGLKFEVNPIRGHKTGFYLDQRDNRKRVEKLASGKSVLNLFAYTGGFSIYAARGGASDIISIDISQRALEVAIRNFTNYQISAQQNICLHKTITGNVFELLSQYASQQKQFDMIIIDPPSFTKSKNDIQTAIKTYQWLTQHALNVLKPRGIIIQSSCSSRITSDAFFEGVHQAARDVDRPLDEIVRTGHPIDHPISFKEGAYLKCLFATG
jgi:23S rRNA (cytosine1962-C5)-methyltransferase